MELLGKTYIFLMIAMHFCTSNGVKDQFLFYYYYLEALFSVTLFALQEDIAVLWTLIREDGS